MDSAREDLDHLVHSPGWSRFVDYIEREWGTSAKGGGARFTFAARAAANDMDDAAAIAKMRQVCFAQREIHALVAWVHGSLKDATKHDQELATTAPADYSRRGGL